MKQRPDGFLTETRQYIVLGRLYPQCLFEVWWSIRLGMENASMDMPPNRVMIREIKNDCHRGCLNWRLTSTGYPAENMYLYLNVVALGTSCVDVTHEVFSFSCFCTADYYSSVNLCIFAINHQCRRDVGKFEAALWDTVCIHYLHLLTKNQPIKCSIKLVSTRAFNKYVGQMWHIWKNVCISNHQNLLKPARVADCIENLRCCFLFVWN